jgi:2-iminobutanoate/2-iminopropanoate deaminase
MTQALSVLPFSKVRLAAGLAFLSGEMAFAEDGSIPDGIAAQTALVLRRIAATLGSVGLGLDDVVQVAVHLVNEADFAAFNAEYRQHFKDPLPVRTTVVARLLAPGALLEVTVTAAQRG